MPSRVMTAFMNYEPDPSETDPSRAMVARGWSSLIIPETTFAPHGQNTKMRPYIHRTTEKST